MIFPGFSVDFQHVQKPGEQFSDAKATGITHYHSPRFIGMATLFFKARSAPSADTTKRRQKFDFGADDPASHRDPTPKRHVSWQFFEKGVYTEDEKSNPPNVVHINP